MFAPWRPTPKDLALTADHIYIWYCHLSQHIAELDKLSALLTTAECQRAQRLRSTQQRQQFIITRAMLRQYLALLTNSDPTDLKIDYMEHGKPILTQQPTQGDIRFNVSHSHDRALIAIAQGRNIGIDIEQINDTTNIDAIVARYFSATEQAEFNALPSALKAQAFFACWTRKEALLKAIGKGISYGVSHINIMVDPRQQTQRIRDNTAANLWIAHDLPVDEDYLACVVSQVDDHAHVTHLKYWY